MSFSCSSGCSERPVTWNEISRRFPDDRDCLASFIALNAAEVLAGEKPGNLLNIVNRPRACGKNIYTIWKEHGRPLINPTGITSLVLRDDGQSLLLYIYDAEKVATTITHPGAAALLRRSGYRTEKGPVAVLKELQLRMTKPGFPHEVGIFLGYPLKDVAGFLGYAPIPFSCQAGWRIYGNPHKSLELAERFVTSRKNMARRLSSCSSPLDCLIKAA